MQRRGKKGTDAQFKENECSHLSFFLSFFSQYITKPEVSRPSLTDFVIKKVASISPIKAANNREGSAIEIKWPKRFFFDVRYISSPSDIKLTVQFIKLTLGDQTASLLSIIISGKFTRSANYLNTIFVILNGQSDTGAG